MRALRSLGAQPKIKTRVTIRAFCDRARERLGQATDAAHQKADEVAGAVKNRVNAGMDSARRAGDQLSEYANQASDAASNIAASVGQKAAQSAETVRAVSSDAVSKAGDMVSPERMRRAGTQASDWVNDTVSRNPLIVGAVGLAIGAIIAAALPSTPQEDKLLGPAADDLKQKAGDAALEGVVAAKEIATEIYQEAASRAKRSKVFPWTTRRNSPDKSARKSKRQSRTSSATNRRPATRRIHPRPLPARPASGRKIMSGEWNSKSDNGRSGMDGSNSESPLQKVSKLADDFKKQASGVAEDVTRQVKEQASNLSENAKDAVSGAGDKLRSAAEDQKNAGADFVTGIAAAVRRAAGEFDNQIPQAGEYIRRAADQIDNTSDAVRQRDLSELFDGVQDFARRQPTAFLGATVLAGFVAIRFLKSSRSSGASSGASQYQNENERRLAGAASRLPQGQGI